MSDLIKYSIEIPINSSVNVLYKRLSTASGLAEWFADDVNLKNNVFTFFWDDSEQSAKILKKKSNKDGFKSIFENFHTIDLLG